MSLIQNQTLYNQMNASEAASKNGNVLLLLQKVGTSKVDGLQ